MSLQDPFACGFAKVAAFDAIKQPSNITAEANEPAQSFKSRECHLYVERYKDIFKSVAENFSIDYKDAIRIFPSLKQKFENWNKGYQENVRVYKSTFSRKAWGDLNEDQKVKHSAVNCKECFEKYFDVFKTFPVSGPKNRALWNKKCKEKSAKISEDARKAYKEANSPFRRKHGMQLIEAQINCPEFKIGLKRSYEEKRAEKLKILREAKKKQESLFEETAVTRAFGEDVSMRCRKRLHLTAFYETVSERGERSKKRKIDIESGKLDQKIMSATFPRAHGNRMSAFNLYLLFLMEQVFRS